MFIEVCLAVYIYVVKSTVSLILCVLLNSEMDGFSSLSMEHGAMKMDHNHTGF